MAFDQKHYIGGSDTGAYQQAAFGPSDPGVIQMSPFTAAGHTFEGVHALARRVANLADRLTGAVPTNGEAKAGLESQPPLFAALMIEANRGADAVRRANDDLDRIERMLG